MSNPLAGIFALSMVECDQILKLIQGKVEDRLGVDPREVDEQKVFEADELLYALRRAAKSAGIELEVV